MKALLADTSGSQMLEFAVALPLLVVFVVGIFDFGEAFGGIACRALSSIPLHQDRAAGAPLRAEAALREEWKALSGDARADCRREGRVDRLAPDLPGRRWQRQGGR
jgi:hypothetical protein